MADGTILIGTSGYSFEDWRGTYYPPDIQKGKMLDYYAKEFQTVEPSDTEFYDTLSYFLGSFASQRETPQEIARDLWLMESQQLGKNYFKKLFKALDKVTKQDCTDLTQRTIDPDALAIVVVGDAEKLKEPLAEIAPVEIIELN